MKTLLALATLMLSSERCLDIVDDDFIRQAPDIFVGIPHRSSDGSIDVIVASVVRTQDPNVLPGNVVQVAGRTNSDIRWADIMAMVDHQHEDYLTSRAFYPAYEANGYARACEATLVLTEGVRYLFILADHPRLRGVEPVTVRPLDPWIQHVEAVVDQSEPLPAPD